MYEPRGGDKPDYQPPAEPQQYGKPPTEQPPYEKPPVEEPPNDKPPGGDCKCDEWKLDPCPGENEPFRRLLLKLEEELETLAKEPTEATNKFPDDLKDADKEYKGIVALVTKYKEFYDKLDCKLAEAASWKDDIKSWLVNRITDAERTAIKNSRRTSYDEIENRRCCDWIRVREKLIQRLDCLEQAKKKEEEAKENYEAIKGLEKTLTDRFAELKTLFERAKALRDEERFKAVYAVSREFNDVYENLSRIRDWFYARKQCDIKVSDSGSCPTSPSPSPSGNLKDDWSPDNFRTELARRLRLLILAKFQRFRWHHAFLTQDSDNKKKKEACEKFRTDRRDQFIQEAEDVMPPKTSGGGGEPGQYPGQQEPGQYPSTGGYQPPQTGGYQQSPPPKGGYEQPPQGGYEQTPPKGGYKQTPPKGGYEQPPQGGYEQTPPKGGYEQTPPQGGYEQTPPAGGYQQTQPPSAYEQPSGGYQQRPPGGGPTQPTEPYKGKKK